MEKFWKILKKTYIYLPIAFFCGWFFEKIFLSGSNDPYLIIGFIILTLLSVFYIVGMFKYDK